ncbi:MAG: exodeoxyribonuclease VII small subunit [Bacteroidaceae bacterium]|nr:exodeoxyribonuclease VII small subunit [Bacteroidaceae bacterium]
MNKDNNPNQTAHSLQGRAGEGSSIAGGSSKAEGSSSSLTYEQAMQQLEMLAAKMEQNEISLDDMAERLREAQQLMKYCRDCLYEAEKNCKSLLSVEEKL